MRIVKNDWIFFLGGGVVGAISMLSLVLFVGIFFSYSKPREPSPPKIAGHKVPAEIYEIDFSKRYNLKLDSQSGLHTYTNCLIKGFTYEERESGSSRRYSYFETWLVIELPDQRLVYLQPGRVTIIEEAKP